MAPGDDIDAADPQDRAETLDETNLTEDGEDIANFDTMPDVFDATSAEDDDDVEGLEAAEDEEDFDDDEVELLASAGDDGRDDEGLGAEGDSLGDPDDNNEVSDVADEPRTFEADNLSDEDKAALGYDDERKPAEHDPHTEKQLDHGLKETFPASDPVSINPGAD